MEEAQISKIMGMVDHTLLKPYASEKEIKKLIDEASQLKTYSVCINPLFARSARRYITNKGYGLKITAVVDFPFGAFSTKGRAKMLKSLVNDIDEADFVVQIGYVKSNKYKLVKKDIDQLTDIAHENGKVIKFIVEDGYTTKEEKQKLYEIVCSSKADFIKTSTGFAELEYTNSIGNKTAVAAAENVKMMSDTIRRLNSNIGIKAAGGIHSYQQIMELFEASGKEMNPKQFRLGMSSTKKIYEEMQKIN